MEADLTNKRFSQLITGDKVYKSVEGEAVTMEADLAIKRLSQLITGDKVYKSVDGTVIELPHYDPGDLPEMRREVETLKQLDHPNLLKYHKVFVIGGRICVELEHVVGGVHGITSESELAGIVRQVLLGLEYLHDNNISHGDIKPSDIFVDSKGQVKVLYLGKMSPKPVNSQPIDNEFYWDVWGVGLFILNLLKGSLMVPSTQMWNFLLCCMQTDVSNRWTIKQLLGHPYLGHPYFHQKGLSDDTHDPPISMGFSSTLSYEAEQINPRKKPKISSLTLESEEESTKDLTQIEIVPDVLGRCRLHCAMFLSDYEFEKDKLIQMWIAEECFEFEETRIMEDVANIYFDELVCEEAIIPSRFDHLYTQMKYKVNIAKISTWFSEQGKYIRIGEGDLDKVSGEALHLVWHSKRLDHTLIDALKNLKHLRTLLVLVDCSVSVKLLPNDTFLGLKLLRTLDLSCTHILELPASIRLLEELRYLDISETPLKRLPEAIDCLRFLQTLKLRGCFGLSSLPKGLGRLINLRHLDLNIVGQLESMPTGMGNLVKLQTLQAFTVGKNDGCGIGELRNMNDISGAFCISKLENVRSAREAMDAELRNKKRINKLELRWQDYGNHKSHDTTEILECLQPHFHLRELQITHYSGLKLPSWISNPSYIDLASITLYKCMNCDILPSIGKLPSLKILHIVEMNILRNIDHLLCRENGIQESNAFPNLGKLILENMLNLEEWTGIKEGDFPNLCQISIRNCPKLSFLPSFSYLCSLQNLEINHCTQLLSLPEGPLPASLESLIVKGCPTINERCLKDGGQDWFKIADVKNVWIDFEKISLD